MIDTDIAVTHGNYSAMILADSLSPQGVRLTTQMVTFPRPYLAELNTHRVFSRNSASSRAIPTEKLIERVRTDPYLPETFRARVAGMGVGDELDDIKQEESRREWLDASAHAVQHAENLALIGIDKSRANRLLEPFMWHTAIITSTEWANYYGLRCPDGDEPDPNFPAQLEFQQLAILMREAMRRSDPVNLGPDEWHTPLMDMDETLDVLHRQHRLENDTKLDELQLRETALQVCARRLARVSFDRHMDTEPTIVSVEKAQQLVTSGHFSPTEHIATPLRHDHLFTEPAKVHVPVYEIARALRSGDTGYDSLRELRLNHCWCGNLRGYWQYRKGFPNEEAVANSGEWPS